ncbi:hypothetical protein GGR51DRAFT_371232 [Nemania sp. FL0031]|nr:hypothetical protein GGR51DRAFT_371232 [Nemania sp. FL0031]
METAEAANTGESQDRGHSKTRSSTPSLPLQLASMQLGDVTPSLDSMVRYFRAMEERIRSLELEVAQLAGSTIQHREKAVATSRSSRQIPSASAVAGIIKLNRDGFESLSQEGEPVYAIEMLVSDNGVVTKIRIRSEELLKIFQNVMGTDIVPSLSQSIVMTRPFRTLMSFVNQLKNKRDDLEQDSEDQTFHDSNEYPDTTTEPTDSTKISKSDKSAMKQCLDILLEALTIDLVVDYTSYSSMRTRSEELVTFSHLWYLFQPGDTVIEGRGQSAQAYLVSSVHEKIPIDSRDITGASPDVTMLSVSCFYIGFDGKIFGPVTKAFTIRHFHGKKSVASLPILPIEYLEKDGIRKLLIHRGSKFSSLSTQRHQTYAGMTMDKELPTELNGEVVVDIELYYRDHADESPPDFAVIAIDEEASIINDDSKVEKYLTERFLKNSEELLKVFSYDWDRDTVALDDERLMLLPNFVWAFYLRGRKWHALDVNMISEVRYHHDAFDYLVLPASHKSILSGLITMHNSRDLMRIDRPESDLVVGKGKGLIMLYHGPPGVGKTSTAESLAAYVRRPLLPITAADIGTTAHEVEMSLQTIFGLSQRWGCILLFDEADIILQGRDRSDFGRNAIVSVFLRALEYYSGILIMTTTRIGTIDEALKSRIHVVLYFPQLDLEMFLKIWEIALHRVRVEKKMKVNMDRIMRFAREVWQRSGDYRMNGRDIQNAVQSAVALAEYDAKRDPGSPIRLGEEHFEPVLRMSDDFNKYMTALHGGSDSMQARLAGDRDDEGDWDQPTSSRGVMAARSLYTRAARPLYTTSRHDTNDEDSE